MIELTEWLRSTHFPDKPWLLLGKGPTFSHRDELDLSAYNTMALNHVVSQMKVNVAHVIDVDVIEACASTIAANCDFLLMPRVPHVQHWVSLRRLEDFVEAIPVLRQLDQAGRLVWYNAETGPAYPGSPVIEVKWFSSEAALNLLAAMGVKTVRSLGIDGGQTYSSAFGNLDNVTRLANGLPSFDPQFTEIERIVRLRGLDYRPLIEPIRVFVGSDESQLVATRVLEYSIRKHTDALVRVSPMLDVRPPVPKKKENRQRTPFSFSRFVIPQLAGYRGRAIYLDADMQVFGDIKELWEAPLGDHHILCTTQDTPPERWKDSTWFHPGPQMSVMVLNCEALDWDVERIVADLDAGRYTYADLLFQMCIVPPECIDPTLPVTWNHLETYEPGVTRLTHYTVVATQPWVSEDNPLRELWMDGYRDAVAAGAVAPWEVEDAVAKGHVRRELLDALTAAPTPKPLHRSSAALELEAARRRIDELHGRQLRGRAKGTLRRLKPLVRTARERAPDSVGLAVERGAELVRRVLH